MGRFHRRPAGAGTRGRERLDVNKPPITGRAVAYYLMFAVIVGSIIYTKVDAGRQISASESRQLDRQTAQLGCMSRVFEDFLQGNQELRVASQKRDRALVESKSALRELVYLRVIQGAGDNATVQAYAQKYMTATQDFIDASKALDKARRTYALPDFEARCGKLEPGFKGAWLADIEGFDRHPVPTGLSIEAP